MWPLASSPADEADESDEGLRRAKEVKAGLPLEKVGTPGVVGQVCFAGTCLPRRGYHNAPELNQSKFVRHPGGDAAAAAAADSAAPTEGKVAAGAAGAAGRAAGSSAAGSAAASTAAASTTQSSSSVHSDSSVSDGSSWVDLGKDGSGGGRKMMLSGDLGVWRPDGKLQILGRVDGMVKVLGSRVDVAEVQTALCDNDALVSDAAVVAVEASAKGGDKELVAYFVPTAGANAQAAKQGLAQVADEVELWESIYDDAYVKKDAVGGAQDEKHAVGYKVEDAKAVDYDDALAGSPRRT